MIAIMGAWFPKKNRGFIVGLWATCNNFGNIAGIQVAAWLLDVFDGEWQWLQVVAGATSVVIFFVVWFFLVPDPESIGIFVEEMTEKEQLIVSATDKEVYENVIRPSRHSLAIKPEDVIQQVRLSQQFRRLSSVVAGEIEKGVSSISFWKAWLLPRVLLYSSAFFCTKMAVYCLLLWMPTFLKTS